MKERVLNVLHKTFVSGLIFVSLGGMVFVGSGMYMLSRHAYQVRYGRKEIAADESSSK
jgi:Cytochrome oxidase c assembly